MATFEIPLSPKPQKFTISLSGTSYQMTVVWRDAPTGLWVLDLADADANPILSGLPLITGADLLAQHRHLPVPPGTLRVRSDGDPYADPTFTNLGIASHLYYVTT